MEDAEWKMKSAMRARKYRSPTGRTRTIGSFETQIPVLPPGRSQKCSICSTLTLFLESKDRPQGTALIRWPGS